MNDMQIEQAITTEAVSTDQKPMETEDTDVGLIPTFMKKEEEMESLIELVIPLELFHSASNPEQAYVRTRHGKRVEVMPIISRRFRRFLANQFRRKHGCFPSLSSVRAVAEGLAAKAQFDEPGQIVAIRVAEHEGVTYIDLCNPKRQVIKVTPLGWQIVSDCPVRFIRQPGMTALPLPQSGGSVDELWEYINIKSDVDRVLVTTWVLRSRSRTMTYSC